MLCPVAALLSYFVVNGKGEGPSVSVQRWKGFDTPSYDIGAKGGIGKHCSEARRLCRGQF